MSAIAPKPKGFLLLMPRRFSPCPQTCGNVLTVALLSSQQVRHIYICDFHKNVIQNVRTKRKRKDSEGGDSPDNDFDLPEVRPHEMPQSRAKVQTVQFDRTSGTCRTFSRVIQIFNPVLSDRLFPNASEHPAALQEALQAADSTWAEQGTTCRRKLRSDPVMLVVVCAGVKASFSLSSCRLSIFRKRCLQCFETRFCVLFSDGGSPLQDHPGRRKGSSYFLHIHGQKLQKPLRQQTHGHHVLKGEVETDTDLLEQMN